MLQHTSLAAIRLCRQLHVLSLLRSVSPAGCKKKQIGEGYTTIDMDEDIFKES